MKQYETKLELVGPEMFPSVRAQSDAARRSISTGASILPQLDHLRQGDPPRAATRRRIRKQEYKREAFELFSDMLDRIKQDVVKIVLTVQVRSAAGRAGGRGAPRGVQRALPARRLRRGACCAIAADDRAGRAAPPPFTRAGQKVGRNDAVPVRIGEEIRMPRAAATGVDDRLTLRLARARCRSTTPPPDTPSQLLPVAGVALGTAAARIKNWARDDVVLVSAGARARAAAGVFTQNRFCAAPVIGLPRTPCARRVGDNARWSINAGNANAGTGDRRSRRRARDVRGGRAGSSAARRRKCCRSRPGVIMEPLPVDRIVACAAVRRAALRATTAGSPRRARS